MTIAFLLLLAAYAVTVFFFRESITRSSYSIEDLENRIVLANKRADHWIAEFQHSQASWRELCAEYDKATLKLERLAKAKKAKK